ncbi:MAG: family 1 extracellular solute-binding protein [Paenibacillus sp.]|nr:family 1 extracellular solute-binding protein [Paenibacillus sp.]
MAISTKMKTFTIGLCTAALLAGCSEGQSESAKPQEPAVSAAPEPVTLSVLLRCYKVSPEEFERNFAAPVKKKYPHITLVNLECRDSKHLDELIVSKELPDIIDDGLLGLHDMLSRDIPADLQPLVRSEQFDLNRIDPKAIEFVRSIGQNGELYSMPRVRSASAVYYNRDLFDKFGAPYPKDGMTWDDYIALSRKLSVQDSNIQYQGLLIGAPRPMQTQLSLPYVDRATDKAAIQSDGWKKMFETWKAIYDIPGNRAAESKDLFNTRDRFIKDKTAAMYADINILEVLLTELENSGTKWDVASYPVFAGQGRGVMGAYGNGLIITKTSKHKEEAFRVIAHLLSDEVQLENHKNGQMTVLVNPEIQKRLWENSPIFKGKNVAAFYHNDGADPYVASRYDQIAYSQYSTALRNYVYGVKDINTVLREAEEATNKAIEAEKRK